MPRMNRGWVSEEVGGYHIISRVVGQQFLLGPEDKDYFVGLLLKLTQSYFVDLHAFCVMDNHFHLLVTMREQRAEQADELELASRYWALSTSDSISAGTNRAKLNLLKEAGVEVVRARLGSLSRFVQELKQSFSRYYNRKHNRKGYLWSDRFKGVIVAHGEAQLVCSAYVDLNPVRAGIVSRAEDYRWSSLGLYQRDKSRFQECVVLAGALTACESPWEWYRCFVAETGGYGHKMTSCVSDSTLRDVRSQKMELGLKSPLSSWIPTISQGVVLGSASLVEQMQKTMGRVFKKARNLWKDSPVFTTRVLKAGYG